MQKNIALLGATGSIGTQTLDLIRKAPQKYKLASVSAYGNDLNKILQIAQEFRPKLINIFNEQKYLELKDLIHNLEFKPQITCGLSGMDEAACLKEVDTVVVAVVGSIGMQATLAALKESKRVVVANKETLVSAGDLVKEYLSKYKGSIIPADSEHVAIHQCIEGSSNSDLRRIVLTASGGPFYNSSKDLNKISVKEALAHPTWQMGPKITINSATMMNKGLEVIEAERLFGLSYDQIDVIIHPQSLIHSLVEFVDGNILAQLGCNDMRLAIQYALDFPARNPNLSEKFLDLLQNSRLEFYPADNKRFPCLSLAYEAGRQGQSYPATLVAADEIAVQLFLEEKISFAQIPELIEKALSEHQAQQITCLNDLYLVDNQSREKTKENAQKLAFKSTN